MTTSESINELAAALAKAQAEMAGAKKDSANPFFKSKYPDLASVREACFPALSKHGIAVVQSPSTEPLTDGGVFVAVETRLMHQSGQWICGFVSAAAKDGTPQSVGSAITYLRRYALMSFAGVAPEDDDAEAAQGRGHANAKTAAAAPTVPAGYDDWLHDLAMTADEGTEVLQRTWKGSKVEYRQYLTSVDPKRWEALKTRAVKASLDVELVRR